MAHNPKYRIEFTDVYDKAIKVDISQEDWAGAVTSLTPTSNPLTIEWNSERANIFNPVRGAIANLNVYSSTDNQFAEFFNAYETEYKMEVYIDTDLFWTGWVMVGEHQELMQGAPYVANFKAYDLGYLQDRPFDIDISANDSIIDVLNNILDETGFDLSIKERVNIFDDSMTSGAAANSPLNQTEVKQLLFRDDDWTSISCYDALALELLTLNSFLMQENGYWNICRVIDMSDSHFYRVFNTSGAVTSSGTEDTEVALTSINQMNRSGIYMSCPTWKEVNITQDFGKRNLIDNGKVGSILPDTASFWDTISGVDVLDYISQIYFSGDELGWFPALRILNSNAANSRYRLKRTYEVKAGQRINFKYSVAWSGAYSATVLQMDIRIVGVSTKFMNLSTGAWQAGVATITSSNGHLNVDDIISDAIIEDGTLDITIYEAVWVAPGTSAAYTHYVNLELYHYNYDIATTEDFSEEIEANNLVVPDEIVLQRGDTNGTDVYDMFPGFYKILATGAATDSWQSIYGSVPAPIVENCRDNYKAQYIDTAKRIQGTLRHELDYLDTINDGGKIFLASSITRDFANSELYGEWIEIKSLWDENMVDDFTNGFEAVAVYDSFSESANEVSIEKTQTDTPAAATIEDLSVKGGVRYKITANVVDNGTSDLPHIIFPGSTKDDLVLGDNEWYIIAAGTTTVDGEILSPNAADTCDLTITITGQEIIGG